MNKSAVNKIYKRIEQIKNDNLNDSSTLLNLSFELLKESLENFADDNFKKYFIDFVTKLSEAKPAMAAMKNIMSRILLIIEHDKDIIDFKLSLDLLEEEIISASQNCIMNAEHHLVTDYKSKIFITCSISGMILNFFSYLSDREKTFHVISLESIFKGIDYGHKLFEELKKKNISVEYLGLENLSMRMQKINYAVIGADAFNNNNDVINGYPSSMLAKTAGDFKVPFIVIAESYKETNDLKIESGFELINHSMITKIIKDK